MNLTLNQKKTLTVLTDLYLQRDSLVKRDDVAREINRKPGTVRNQLQTLTSLQLVESKAGPNGGYKPTKTAFDVLNIEWIKNPETIQITHDGEVDNTISIRRIKFTTVHHPERCQAEIGIQGPLSNFNKGDTISVGPTPVSKLQIIGTIHAINKTHRVLFVDIADVNAPAKE